MFFHVSLLRPYKARASQGVGAPPALLPTGVIEHEVQEIVGHHDDADNERWYQVKWLNHGDITWEPEGHLSNCLDKIRSYFAKEGLPMQKLPRPSKRKKRIPVPAPKVVMPEESTAAKGTEASEESSLRRSARFKRLMTICKRVTSKARDFVYGETLPPYV